MSDPAAEPGAPTGGATEKPHAATEKSIAREAQRHTPKLTSLASTPDRIILRLNKLLASPGGLSSFLSTFNYTLYLLAFLESKSLPLKQKIYQLLGRTLAAPALNVGPSNIAALGGLLSSTRTTLRLFGLFPLYAWFRQLSHGPKPGQDQVLYTTSLTQCCLYLTFQFLENVAYLTDHKVLPVSTTQRWTAKHGGTTANIYLWSYRAWMGGVACDFVRLFREAQIEREKRANRTGTKDVSTREEDDKVDAKWWSQALVPMCWLPVALQFSKVGGLPGMNLGIIGALGATAGLGRTTELWLATSE